MGLNKQFNPKKLTLLAFMYSSGQLLCILQVNKTLALYVFFMLPE